MNVVRSVIALGALMWACELVWPGRALPKVRGFLPRAIAASALQVASVVALAPLWDRVLLEHRPPWAAAIAQLPAPLAAGLGYFAITFVYYFWHRARHELPWLWRHVHQLHHSASRIEVITSFYKHPLEIVLNGLLSSAVLYALVGLDADSAALAVLLTGIAELFYHWNVRTPHWLGYFVQRPEGHRVHHRRGHHRDNYSDLPLWDMLFGTFDNPREEVAHCGFDDREASR